VKRDTLVAVLLALLAVVALGVAAATLDSAVSLDGGSFGGDDGAATGPGSDSDQTGVSSSSPGGEFALTPPVCVESLREPPGLLLFAGILVGIGAFAYRDTDSRFAAVTVAATLGVPLGALWWLVSVCRPLDAAFDVAFGAGSGDEGILPEGDGGGSGLGGSGDGAVSTPESLFAVVVVVALLASLAVLLAAAGDDNADATGGGGRGEEPDESQPDLSAVGRTAGEAADRIESLDADNEVYRAWRDMTAVLDVDRPESSTPAEFAAAAIDAGVDKEPVTDLTAVFERVRYGGEDPTDDRERQAVEALRRIETRHGGDE